MREINTPISVRLSAEEMQYLEKYSIENGIVNSKSNPSRSSALKHILREKINSKPDEKISMIEEIQKLKKMLEQIHVSIPNMANDMRVVSRYTQELILARNDNKQLFNKVKASVDESLQNTYGAFQTYNYDTLHCSINHKNMKTIPIEKDKNRWK